METENAFITADKARELSVKGRKDNLNKVMSNVSAAANQGLNHAILYNTNLTVEEVSKLIEKGYAVSKVTMLDQMELYKAGW